MEERFSLYNVKSGLHGALHLLLELLAKVNELSHVQSKLRELAEAVLCDGQQDIRQRQERLYELWLGQKILDYVLRVPALEQFKLELLQLVVTGSDWSCIKDYLSTTLRPNHFDNDELNQFLQLYVLLDSRPDDFPSNYVVQFLPQRFPAYSIQSVASLVKHDPDLQFFNEQALRLASEIHQLWSSYQHDVAQLHNSYALFPISDKRAQMNAIGIGLAEFDLELIRHLTKVLSLKSAAAAYFVLHKLATNNSLSWEDLSHQYLMQFKNSPASPSMLAERLRRVSQHLIEIHIAGENNRLNPLLEPVLRTKTSSSGLQNVDYRLNALFKLCRGSVYKSLMPQILAMDCHKYALKMHVYLLGMSEVIECSPQQLAERLGYIFKAADLPELKATLELLHNKGLIDGWSIKDTRARSEAKQIWQIRPTRIQAKGALAITRNV